MAHRVRLAREKRGMTQLELSKAAGLKQPDVSKIERAKILQTTGIARLAAALGVQARWLELGEGDEPDWTSATPPPSIEGRANPAAPETLSDAEWIYVRALRGGAVDMSQAAHSKAVHLLGAYETLDPSQQSLFDVLFAALQAERTGMGNEGSEGWEPKEIGNMVVLKNRREPQQIRQVPSPLSAPQRRKRDQRQEGE